ncbi:MAG: hypothetical protein WC894_05890 [Patescibacteria group bacterium]
MIKKKTKKITIDELAVLMKAGFGQVNKHIDSEIENLAKMIKEDVVDHMATKEDLKKVEEKLTNKIEGINKRLDHSAETKVGYDKFNPLVKRVDVLEKV